MRRLSLFVFLCAFAAWGQANRGEVRFRVIDPSGAALRSTVDLRSEATGYGAVLQTDGRGLLSVPMLPFGAYEVLVAQPGFKAWSGAIEVGSGIPVEYRVQLAIAGTETEIRVAEHGNLVDLENRTAS